MLTLELEGDFTAFVRRTSRNRQGNRTRLGQFLRKAVPGIRRVQLPREREIEIDGRLRVVRRPWNYELPSLDKCRAHWDEEFGGPYEWPAVEPDDEVGEEEVPF